jgi:hypothetical protein
MMMMMMMMMMMLLLLMTMMMMMIPLCPRRSLFPDPATATIRMSLHVTQADLMGIPSVEVASRVRTVLLSAAAQGTITFEVRGANLA